MASTEWWQRGPVDGVPAVFSPSHTFFCKFAKLSMNSSKG